MMYLTYIWVYIIFIYYVNFVIVGLCVNSWCIQLVNLSYFVALISCNSIQELRVIYNSIQELRVIYNFMYHTYLRIICLHRDRDGSLSTWYRRRVHPPWNDTRRHLGCREFRRGSKRGWWQPVSQWYWWWRCRNYGRNACGRWHPRGIWNSITWYERLMHIKHVVIYI